VANWPSTKRALLVLALAGLAVVELGLLESFLPYEWLHVIHQQTERAFPNAKYVYLAKTSYTHKMNDLAP
jgi:hypothetical protein